MCDHLLQECSTGLLFVTSVDFDFHPLFFADELILFSGILTGSDCDMLQGKKSSCDIEVENTPGAILDPT